MKILICPDKFKESLTAGQVSACIASGIYKAIPDAECKLLPLADGGEDTAMVLTTATGGHFESATVHDPLMRLITSTYGISGDGTTAFIEMAAASGLALLHEGERNPMNTTTYGTGELIKHALDKGCTRIIIGIGGSATVDGGTGMAQALGVKFEGIQAGDGGGRLNKITRIDVSGIDERIGRCEIIAACDVQNVLTGSNGASFVFGAQKGANQQEIKMLDQNLNYLASLIARDLGRHILNIEGGGAAGGMGAGIVSFLNGKVENGFELVARTVNLSHWIQWTDIIVTGEGKIDHQTAYGKTPAGVASAAAEYGKPVIGFAGVVAISPSDIAKLGIQAVFPITDQPMSLDSAMKDAGRLLQDSAERVFRTISIVNSL
jgi:glycerate kinase